MSIAELTAKVQIETDAEGNERFVLSREVWEELLTLLEDREDAEELVRLRDEDEEIIPWEQAKAELQAQGVDI